MRKKRRTYETTNLICSRHLIFAAGKAQGREIVRRGFCPADLLYTAIVSKQEFSGSQLAVEVVAMCIGISASVVKHDQVADGQAGQGPVQREPVFASFA